MNESNNQFISSLSTLSSISLDSLENPTKNPAFLRLYLRLLQFALLCAAATFFMTIHLPYLGEEGVYTITTLEMLHNKDWFAPTLYGVNYGRPPLYNWLIIPVTSLLGIHNILPAARLVTLFATLVTAILLIWFVKNTTRNKSLAYFTALIYLSGDLLFRRGWLAYADPVFSLFVFGSMISLWMAVEKQKTAWFYLSALALIGSFLTKAFTGYIFYFLSALILIWLHPNRRILFSKKSILIHALALSFPFFWSAMITRADSSGMIHDMMTKFSSINFGKYVLHLIYFPIDIFLIRWLPISALIIFIYIRRKRFISNHLFSNTQFKIILGFILINLIPYWLSPETRIRYLLPLYPWIAFAFALIIWNLDQSSKSYSSDKPSTSQKSNKTYRKIALTLLILGICFRYFFLYLETHSLLIYSKNAKYNETANTIHAITHNQTLYAEDYSATGLSVVAKLNQLRSPNPPLKRIPNSNPKPNSYIIAYHPNYPNTKIIQTFMFGKTPLYLLYQEK